MSVILGHYSRNGAQILSKWIYSVEDKLSKDSLEYFDKVFVLAPKHIKIELTEVVSCSLTIRQLLRRAVCTLWNSPIRKFKSSSVLTFGFQKSYANGEIQSLFPNHLHNHFLTEPWTELHKLIGDEGFILLLTECSIFITLPESNNLLQISGSPLSDEVDKVPSFNAVTTKKLKSKQETVFVNRSRILYGRPIAPQNYRLIGLPFNHALNNCKLPLSSLIANMFNYSTLKTCWQKKRLESLANEFLKGHQKCQYAAIYNYYTSKPAGSQLSHYQVFGFLLAVLKRVLPNNFIKCTGFIKHLRNKIWTFLRMNRFEKMSVDELIRGLCLKELIKVFDPKHRQNTSFQNPLEHEKIKGFTKAFLHFLFENYLVDLLRCNFYITELSNSRCRLVFYRHDTWNQLTTPVLESFQETMFRPAEVPSANFGIKASRSRLVPKGKDKFRPIVAFKKPPSSEEGNRLRASFDILKYFYEIDMSVSVMGFSGLQSRLLTYKTKCKSSGPFYLAKLDISGCFDSIPHDKLFALLANLLERKEFSVRRVDQIQMDHINNRPIRKITRIARDANYNGLNHSTYSSSSVTIDRVSGKFHSGEDIFRTIHDHLINNIVQINGKFFKQKKGIPQGSFLSTILCSLFYGQFDKDTGLIHFPSDDLVLRYVDDFLIVSPCRDRLERLVEFIQNGFPEFGIVINRTKTRFSMDLEGPLPLFSWCGLRINPQTLDISPDYSNFEFKSTKTLKKIVLLWVTLDIADSISSRERNFKVGCALQRQLHYFLRPKLRKLFHQMNSFTTIVFNLIQSFAMVAIKLHSYLRDLPHKIRPEFLEKCIDNVIRYCCKLVRLKNHPDLIKSVAWNTFYCVLKRKGTRYHMAGLLNRKKEFPLPTAYENLLKESLEPFFNSIKY